MKKSFSWQKFLPHLIAVVGFIVLSVIYASPVLQGRKLNQYDDVQAKGAAREIVDYHKKTGEWSSWTNTMFAGMPAFLIAGDYPTSIPTKLGQGVNKILPAPANYLLIGMISAYILFMVMGTSSWLAALGAISFSFATFNLVSLEAGHVSKVLAYMYAPGVLAGVLLAFRKGWLAGAALTALFLSLELYANHVQVTYYLGIGIVILVLVKSFSFIKEGRTKELAFIWVGLGFAAAVAVGSHTTRLWNAYDYTKETIRGKPELTAEKKAENAPEQTGLGKEYAFSYSYGWGELITFLVPDAYGGASNGSLSAKSETYKVLVGKGVDGATAQNVVQSLPLYWGDQPIVGGPAYFGSIVIFFFILGLLIVRGPIKYWAAGVIVLYVIWALGRNFAAVNYLFFDYFPMFNKFRAMTMIVSLVQLLMVFIGILGLNAIVKKEISTKDLQKPFLIALGISAGLCLILAVMPGVFFNFHGAADAQILASFEQSTQDKGFAQELLNGILKDREGLLKADAFRSLIFILLAAALVWFWMKDKLKPVVVFPALIALTIFDLFGVDKRYLSDEDFVSSYVTQANSTPSPADEQILRDPDPDYKVFDLSSQQGPFNSAAASYFHKSLGGYHGAKLRRYQEVFERQIAKPNANPGILNMLNTKYILTTDQQGNKIAQTNPDAYGHAWFVSSYKLVPNADAEMAALDSLKPKTEAVLDQKFAAELNGLTIKTDSTSKISLVGYKPDALTYETSSSGEGLAVFSEIYYNVHDEWKVTIDDKPVKLLRANYILRALRIPAGKHTVKFSFEPISVAAGHKIDLVSSIFLVVLVAGAIFVEFRKNKNQAS